MQKIKYRSSRQTNIALLSLLLANVTPLLGVIWWDWDVGLIILLYWSENIIVGFYTLMKMLVVGRLYAIPMAIFFIMHYGFFTLIHGIFAFQLAKLNIAEPNVLDNESGVQTTHSMDALYAELLQPLFAALPTTLLIPFICLFISHGISFVSNFLLKEEYRGKNTRNVMFSPYSRIIVMHITIIFGGFFLIATNAPVGMVAVLVLIKTILDVILHRKSHQQRSLFNY